MPQLPYVAGVEVGDAKEALKPLMHLLLVRPPLKSWVAGVEPLQKPAVIDGDPCVHTRPDQEARRSQQVGRSKFGEGFHEPIC